jgi:uncharacterized protein (DUF488 family)
MTRGRVETLGYTENESTSRIETFLAYPRSYLVDIRYKPYSRWNPNWNRQTLKVRYGRQYVHLPGLGNINYGKPDQPIVLANPEQHLSDLATAVNQGASYLLLCACKDYERCHRKIVYSRIMAILDPTRVQEPEKAAEQLHIPRYYALSLWEPAS